MTGSLFVQRDAPPTVEALARALGDTAPFWDAIVAHAEAAPGVARE